MSRRVSSWMLTACGLWLMGLGFYFVFLRPPLLPEDARFMGTSLEQIRVAAPGLEAWLNNVFTVIYVANRPATCAPHMTPAAGE